MMTDHLIRSLFLGNLTRRVIRGKCGPKLREMRKQGVSKSHETTETITKQQPYDRELCREKLFRNSEGERSTGLGSRSRESGSWVRQVTRSSAESAEVMLNYRRPGGGSAIVPMDREWG